MKLRKLILPAILALGAVGGFALAKANSERFAAARAMNDYSGDPSVDVGLNIQRTKYQATTWEPGQFYINSFESQDVSGGTYVAVRIKAAEGAGSYFNITLNVSGNANGVPYDVAAPNIKCVPAVPNGVAFDYAGARAGYLPLNLWSGADIWFCIPKTTFTRNHFGSGTINWSDPIWAIYFEFYGVTQDNVDFDIGDIYTANIDGDGHFVKVTRLVNWAKIEGTGTNDAEDGTYNKLAYSRNFPSLVPGVKFIQAIENVDACDGTAAAAAYDANIVAYTALSNANKVYLGDAVIADYADGDTAHAGSRTTGWTAAAKWAAICEAAGHTPSRVILFKDTDKTWLFVTIGAVSAVSLAGLFFILRRRRALNK